ncbi:MAG: hypothetical protein AB1609_06570 [Bacillota bacterium]
MRAIPWTRVLAVLVAANLLLLGHSIWRYRQERALHRALWPATAEAYAGLLGTAGAIRDRLLFNLGNRYFEEGIRSNRPDMASKAAAYYREALRLNPELLEAKKNHELASRFLETIAEPGEGESRTERGGTRPSPFPLEPTDI